MNSMALERMSFSDYVSTPVKKDQLAFISPKVWGHEEWVVNHEKYCGKKLVFKQGGRCSLHYHKIKDETFYVMAGRVFLELIDNGEKIKRIMTPGDVQRVATGVVHRLTALENAEVIEFSTFHMEEDSYRIELAGVLSMQELEKCISCL